MMKVGLTLKSSSFKPRLLDTTQYCPPSVRVPLLRMHQLQAANNNGCYVVGTVLGALMH